jgi:hypothetical protein
MSAVLNIASSAASVCGNEDMDLMPLPDAVRVSLLREVASALGSAAEPSVLPLLHCLR